MHYVLELVLFIYVCIICYVNKSQLDLTIPISICTLIISMAINVLICNKNKSMGHALKSLLNILATPCLKSIIFSHFPAFTFAKCIAFRP